jgi:NADPH oxidase
VWIILHMVGFAFSLIQYGLKDNFVTARSIFGDTYGESYHLTYVRLLTGAVIARGAAQVLHSAYRRFPRVLLRRS